MFKIELSEVFVVKTPVKFNFLKHLLWTIIHTEFANPTKIQDYKTYQFKGNGKVGPICVTVIMDWDILRLVARDGKLKIFWGGWIEILNWELESLATKGHGGDEASEIGEQQSTESEELCLHWHLVTW